MEGGFKEAFRGYESNGAKISTPTAKPGHLEDAACELGVTPYIRHPSGDDIPRRVESYESCERVANHTKPDPAINGRPLIPAHSCDHAAP